MPDWNTLKKSCEDCSACPLHATRTNCVFGVGNPQAKLMFVGEAPGEQEDLTGIPFVGKAGQLLDKFLFAVDLSREDVYIANILKCRKTLPNASRPSGNHNEYTAKTIRMAKSRDRKSVV